MSRRCKIGHRPKPVAKENFETKNKYRKDFMKLSTAFDGIEKENRYLRTTTKMLIMVTTFLLGIVYNLYDKMPIMVERSSHGLEIVRPTEFARSEVDLKTATALMMKARFATDTMAPELFLNQKQLLLRDTEQKDLKSRGMSQSIIVKNVTIEKDMALVDLDRLISVGDVRSALKAKVKVRFEEVSPNELNPYGILLSLSDPIKDKEPEK